MMSSWQVSESPPQLVMPSSWKVSELPHKFLNIIIYYFFLTFVADLPTHGSPPYLFFLSQICVTPMVLILINTPRVFFKYSEQLADCQLIQPNANQTNMTLIVAPLLPSVTNSIII
jgi:hypothetical protein